MKANGFSPAPALIEALESRVAPAALLPGGKVVTFTDIDGDNVTVKFSKPVLTDANVGSVFLFNDAFANTGPQQLNSLQLRDLGPAANGVDVTITAHRSVINGGNGQVNITAINASDVVLATGIGPGIDLGKVRVQGSVNFIDAGDTELNTPAVKSIDVLSLGLLFPGIQSDFHGSIGSLKIRGSLGGHIGVKSGIAQSQDELHIGSITIGGSLLGSSSINTGFIEAGTIGSIKINKDISGGDGDDSARIAASKIERITVGGSIIGGDGKDSGSINANSIASINVRGSVHGGTTSGSGSILASQLQRVSVGGDVSGGDGPFTGLIQAGSLDFATVRGSVFGGAGTSSGRFSANDMGTIKIGGSLVGGDGLGSGSLGANTIDVVTIGGDLIGGDGDSSGQIFGGGDLRVIKGSVLGFVPVSGKASVAAGIYASIFDIARIVIGGDFSNANIAVGVFDGGDDALGDGNDGVISNTNPVKIASLTIKGRVTSNIPGVAFGIEANAFGKVQIGGITFNNGDPGVNFSTGFKADPLGRLQIRAVA